MKKNGFTLIELLAVLIIMGILVVIAVPNVINMLNEGKRKSFETDVIALMKSAQNEYTIDKALYKTDFNYGTGELTVDTPASIKYCIRVNNDGTILSATVIDTSKRFIATGTTINNIVIEDHLADTVLSCN